MLRQIKLLTGLQLCNLFGLNELRHAKDKKTKLKYIGMACLWAFVILVLIGYIAGFSYGIAEAGAEEVIPMLLYTLVSIVMLVFTFLKAGSVLFSMKTYEMLISMPFYKVSIVVSRFINMYATNLMLGVLVMLPGCVVYVIYEEPGITFYAVTAIALIFLPLLPLTLASIGGAIITALASKVRHKGIGEAVFMMLFVVVVMVCSMLFGEQAESLDMMAFFNIAKMLENMIAGIYPPAAWYAEAIEGSIVSFILMLLIPMVIFAVFAVVTGKYFQRICAAINSVNAKNDYKMESLSKSSVVKALCIKELKRYLSSGVYLSNTIVGYVMGLIFVIAILVTGVDSIIGLLGIVAGSDFIAKLVPFVLALMFMMGTTTSSAISMEGKNFWQILSLPVRSRDVYTAKILMNLIVVAPFWLVCGVLMCVAVKPDILTAVWIFVIPAVFVCFMAVVGLAINIALPVLNWESEARVVKQSAAAGITPFAGMLGAIAAIAVLIVFRNFNTDIMIAVILVVLSAVTYVLYKMICRKELIRIGEK